MNENIKETDEITLSEILSIFFKNIWIVIVSVVGCLAIGIVYTFGVVEPMYQSNASIMVQVDKKLQSGGAEDSTGFDVTVARILMYTVMEFMQKDVVLDVVAEEYDLTASEIRSNLSISSNNTSSDPNFFIELKYRNLSNEDSRDILNRIIEVAKEKADNDFPLIKGTILPTDLAKQGKYVSPNKMLYLIISVFLGGVLGVSIIFAKELLDNTFKSKVQVERELGLNVIGHIPSYNAESEEENNEI